MANSNNDKLNELNSAKPHKIVDYQFFLDYLKFFSMILFGISMTTPVMALIMFDMDVAFIKGREILEHQSFLDKPFLPYLTAFFILMIHWLKFTEINHSLKNTDSNHLIITFIYFFLLCLYPYFEMNIEFTSDDPVSRVLFTAAWGAMGVFAYLNLFYADKNDLIRDDFHPLRIAALKREIIVDPIVAAVCIPLSWVGFQTWLIAMVVLIPATNIIMFRISKSRNHL